ncbi:hypothetical protein BDQ17DRAFT_1261861, partial [Cyathus striatus]
IPASSPHSSLSQRNLISPSDLRPSFDYIIPGGGLAGLVLASRLSEDSSVGILVLGAGALIYSILTDDADTPSGAFYTCIVVGTQCDWAHQIVHQWNLAIGIRDFRWPRARKVYFCSLLFSSFFFVASFFYLHSSLISKTSFVIIFPLFSSSSLLSSSLLSLLFAIAIRITCVGLT